MKVLVEYEACSLIRSSRVLYVVYSQKLLVIDKIVTVLLHQVHSPEYFSSSGLEKQIRLLYEFWSPKVSIPRILVGAITTWHVR